MYLLNYNKILAFFTIFFYCILNKKTPQNQSPEELKNLFEIVRPETYD